MGMRKIIVNQNKLIKPDPIIIERNYNAPLSKVWKAITDKDDETMVF